VKRSGIGSRGQTTVEFAIVGVIFFLLLIGVFEIGRFAYGVNALTNGAREGARYAVAGANSLGCTWVSGNGLDKAARAQIQGLPSADITVSATPDSVTTPTYCEVTVQWAYKPASGGFGGVFAGRTVKSISREYFN